MEELNGASSKPEEESTSNRMVTFDIDLNETPISSPRDVALAGAGDDGATPAAKGERVSGSGKGKVVLLDINAMPSEGEEEQEESCELVNCFGMHGARETSVGESNNSAVACSDLLVWGNHFDFIKTSGSPRSIATSCTVDIVQRKLNYDRNLKEAVPFRNLSEKALQALREYVISNNGILEDGWHVEFFYCQKKCQTRVIYCSPDGNKFESMLDVASHLGLVSNCHSLMPQERNGRFALLPNRSHLPEIRKESIFSRTEDLKGYRESLKSSFSGELSLGTGTMDAKGCQHRINLSVQEASPEGNTDRGSLRCKDGFPVQFEDFFILSVGNVDPRPSYHSATQIWPIGYKSSWHDKITGSLFVCNISDGGDSGPVFKVQRFPCSAQPMPIGSTILTRTTFSIENKKIDSIFYVDDYEDVNAEMMFLESSPPRLDFDIISGVGTEAGEACNSQPMCSSYMDSICISQNLDKFSANDERLSRDIGEFQAEGRSSSSVWRMVSQHFVRTCHEVYRNTGVCKFYCSHNAGTRWPSCLIIENVQANESTDSLTKFCHESAPFNILCNIQSNDELTTSCEALVKWLDQDRFGLDLEFVQEMIEQLPGVHGCSDYTFLNRRCNKSKLQTVGSGFLLAKRKSDVRDEVDADDMLRGCKVSRKQVAQSCPPGKLLSSKLPTKLVGDVLQSWELLLHFSGVFGLQETFSFKELEEELIDCYSFTYRCSSISTSNGMIVNASSTEGTESIKIADKVKEAPDTCNSCSGKILTKAHCSLLKVLLTELQFNLSAFVDPILESGESKTKKRRKKEADNLMFAKKSMLDWLPINGLTWPELARRYLLAVSSARGNQDSVEIMNRKSCQVLNCLQGHSGPICSSLPGVAGIEADALLLAEATKQIFGSLNSLKDHVDVGSDDSDAAAACKTENTNDSKIPEWAQVLEPVRKLPTNVGARIRKRIYEALDKNPPEWAKKILEHSISKEVYKGNASGPTKKAVLSVLASVHGENQPQKPNMKKKNKYAIMSSEVIMKQCQKVLRRAAAADKDKVFCNLLGRTLVNISDNDDERLLGFPSVVSCPLDFRTIDLRLTFGAYGGSHEAFLEDVREVWHHIRSAFAEQSDLVHLAETLSQNFEELYQKEVLTLVYKLKDYDDAECLSTEAKKDIEDIFEQSSEVLKAPWDEGVCKICGVDKDDDSVLLCDECDSGYHTYCLNPPLAKIPEGNWYCPSCFSGQCMSQDAVQVTQSTERSNRNRQQGEFSVGLFEPLNNLGLTMEVKDYWEYNIQERIFLLKFLGDEVLNCANIREHLEKCISISTDLQQKLRSLSTEWRNLRVREEILAKKVGKINTIVLNAVGRSGKERMAIVLPDHVKQTGLSVNGASVCSLPFNHEVQFGDGVQWLRTSSRSPFMESLDSEIRVNQPPGRDSRLIRDNFCSNMPSSIVRDELCWPKKPAHAPQQQQYNSNEDNPSTDFRKEAELNRGGDFTLAACYDKKGNNLSATFRTHMVDYMHAMHVNFENPFPGHHSFVQPDPSGLQTCDLEANFIKNKISALQDSIAYVESQLQKVSLRKDILGRDSAGRLYWTFFRPGLSPWVVVDGTIAVQQMGMLKECRDLSSDNLSVKRSPIRVDNFSNLNRLDGCGLSANQETDAFLLSSPWFSYQSDAEIQELLRWLRAGDMMERELLESLLQRLNFGNKEDNRKIFHDTCQHVSNPVDSKKTVACNDLVTKALMSLEKKYGPCLEVDDTNDPMKWSWNAEEDSEERMCRCECLELIWSSRHHCNVCHMSVSSVYELKEHKNGKCSSDTQAFENSCKVKGNALKGKEVMNEHGECSDTGKISKSSRVHDPRLTRYLKDTVSPYNLEDISAKFVTRCSNKELVREIGLLGSNGIPSFVHSVSPYLCDPALKLSPSWENEVYQRDEAAIERSQLQKSSQGIVVPGKGHLTNSNNLTKNHTGVGNGEPCKPVRETMVDSNKNQSLSCSKLRNANFSEVRKASLRSPVGRGAEILRQLKINLLDMEAALSKESLKPSKACLERRYVWRAFVKSAKSVFQMVQATIVFENMIKTECIRNEWWYWFPLSAASKVATLSSLALRIYSLDAAILYDKSFSSSPDEIAELDSKLNQNSLPPTDPSSYSKTISSVSVPGRIPSPDPTANSKAHVRSGTKRKDSGG